MPPSHYTKSGDLFIAYQLTGDGSQPVTKETSTRGSRYQYFGP